MKNTEAAFRWIISILQKHSILYQIDGGFAARLYGSVRELADIDINVPEEALLQILPDVKDYVIFGPKRYVDESWDLMLMTLMYEGQTIDLSGEPKIFDQNTKEWFVDKLDFAHSINMEAYGISVPVIAKTKLVEYKSKLLREVDKEDIAELQSIGI